MEQCSIRVSNKSNSINNVEEFVSIGSARNDFCNGPASPDGAQDWLCQSAHLGFAEIASPATDVMIQQWSFANDTNEPKATKLLKR
jgi:hypothetical protein